jgi:hypothetical protein
MLPRTFGKRCCEKANETKVKDNIKEIKGKAIAWNCTKNTGRKISVK